MDNIMPIDELEAFVLDFLAYRREKTICQPPVCIPEPIFIPATQNIVDKTSTNEPPTEPNHVPLSMVDSIGKGWPYYKNILQPEELQHTGTAFVWDDHIILTLSPLVVDALNHFGVPKCQKSINHLINHVIASVMSLPQASECIQTAELSPWGRIHLLKAVIELLIILHVKIHPPYKI